ncbi:MAG TPA: hypothetical protein PKE30_19615 [Niabella sp.]|nr:hypothetical protein [Niabella sp.]
MRSTKKLSLFIIAGVLALGGCKKEKTAPEPEKPFDIKEHFVAFTFTPKSGPSKYTVVSFIQFLENNEALQIGSSATNARGNYTLTKDSLIFEVTGGNGRTARFSLDKDKKITSAYYKASGPLEYETTGELFPLAASNQLAGKTFKGDEQGMTPGTISRAGLIYSFNKADIATYGSGTDAAAIDNTTNSYTLFGGNGFKSTNSDGTELGFISNKKLTVFRLKSLYFSGKYDQQ